MVILERPSAELCDEVALLKNLIQHIYSRKIERSCKAGMRPRQRRRVGRGRSPSHEATVRARARTQTLGVNKKNLKEITFL